MSNIKYNIIKFQLYFCSLKFIPSFITVYILSFFELIYNFYNNIFKISNNEEIESLIQNVKNDIAKKNAGRKIVVITGGISGIGRETVISLAKANYIIYIGDNINEDEIKEIQLNLRKESENDDIYIENIDLSKINTINTFVEKIKNNCRKIDILICNAGIMNTPYMIDEKGFEMQISVNYFGHYKLIELLINNIKASKGRIIILSSVVHYQVNNIDFEAFKSKEKYRRLGNYALSKVCLTILMKELYENYSTSGVQVYSVHPGVVRTPLYKYDFFSNTFVKFFPIALKSPKEGSLTTVYLALEKCENLSNGEYYFDCEVVPHNPLIDNKEVRSQLIEYTKNLNL